MHTLPALLQGRVRHYAVATGQMFPTDARKIVAPQVDMDFGVRCFTVGIKTTDLERLALTESVSFQ